MVYGQNLSKCCECGNSFVCGDAIDLICSECDRQRKAKITPDNKGELKQKISNILTDTLSGTNDVYRYKQDGISYIRWGIVQQHIDEAIDLYWSKGEKNDE